MAKSPKAPKPTAEEQYLQRRQTEELTKLDEQANTRIKRLKRDAYSAPMGGRADAQSSARRSTPADDKLGVPTYSGGGLAGMVAGSRAAVANTQAAQASRERASGAASTTASVSPAARPTRFRGKVATR